MVEVKIGQLQNMLYKYIQKEKPLFVHGAPGIGKSDSVRAACKRIAKEKGLEFNEGNPKKGCYTLVDVRISQLDPSDLRGIPIPEDGKTKWLTPKWLPDEGEGTIFMDEINLAPPSIQASCYQLILDRRIGDYVLPDGWTIVAAGNRATDKANVYPMSAPLKNRFAHVTLNVPSEEDWREWAMENDIKSDVIAFMAFKPTLLFKFNSSSKDDAFPTPRSWALASFVSYELTGKTQEELDEEFVLVASCVGEGAAMEYQGFVKLKKRVKVDEILKNPKKVKELTDLGLKYSLVSGLAEKYKQEKKLMEPILEVTKHLDTEFGVFLLRMMKGMRPKTFSNDLMGSKNWKELFKAYNKYLL